MVNSSAITKTTTTTLTKMWCWIFLLVSVPVLLVKSQANEMFKDCTRELYDRVVRFEYLYYEGYWMYPYNKLRNHGPSYHYTEKDFYSANDMNTNAYKSAIHKVHERTIYEPSNALPYYVRDCGGGWACFESRHKDWRFYYLSVNTRLTEPEVVMEWSLNPMVSGTMMHKIKCTDCEELRKCNIIHQTGLKHRRRIVRRYNAMEKKIDVALASGAISPKV